MCHLGLFFILMKNHKLEKIPNCSNFGSHRLCSSLGSHNSDEEEGDEEERIKLHSQQPSSAWWWRSSRSKSWRCSWEESEQCCIRNNLRSSDVWWRICPLIYIYIYSLPKLDPQMPYIIYSIFVPFYVFPLPLQSLTRHTISCHEMMSRRDLPCLVSLCDSHVTTTESNLTWRSLVQELPLSTHGTETKGNKYCWKQSTLKQSRL